MEFTGSSGSIRASVPGPSRVIVEVPWLKVCSAISRQMSEAASTAAPASSPSEDEAPATSDAATPSETAASGEVAKLGFITKFGQVTANYDANGHYARVAPAASNIFEYAGGALEPIPPSQQFDGIEFGIFERCPGAATQPAADGSSPFLDAGNLLGQCDPSDVPPGTFP